MQEQELQRLLVRLMGDGSSYKKMMEDAEKLTKATNKKMVSDTQKAAKKMSAAFKSVGAGVKDFGKKLMLRVTLPLAGAAAAVTKLGADAETTRVQFETMLGKDKGNVMLENLRKFSAATPFRFPELAASARVLIGFGVEQDKVIGIMQKLGDTAAGTGADIKALATIYGQVKGAGKLMGQDFLQFVNAGVGAKAFADTMGLSMTEFRKEIEKGNVSLQVVEDTFKNLTSEGGLFNNMMEKLSKTTTGKFSTLLDNVMLLGASFGEILLPIVNKVLDVFLFVTKQLKAMPKSMKVVIVTFAAIATIIPVVITAVGGLIMGIGGIIAAFTAASGVVTPFVVPITAVVVAVSAFTAALIATAVALPSVIDAMFGPGSFHDAIEAAEKILTTLATTAKNAFLRVKEKALELTSAVFAAFQAMGESKVAKNVVAFMKGLGEKTLELGKLLINAFQKGAIAALEFTKKTIGFFLNIKHNWGVFTKWLGDNWQNILRDMGTAFVQYIKNINFNVGVTVETMIRVFTLWQGFMLGMWKRVFSIDFIGWAKSGIIAAADIFANFAIGVWDALRNIFTGKGKADSLKKQAKTLGATLADDFKAGFNTDNIVKDTYGVIAEQSKKFKSPLEGFTPSTEAPKIKTDIPKKDTAPKGYDIGLASGLGIPFNNKYPFNMGNVGSDGVPDLLKRPKVIEISPDSWAKAKEEFSKATTPEAVKVKSPEVPKVSATTNTTPHAAGNNFKVMSLNRFSVSQFAAPAAQKQEVVDKEVSSKMDTLIDTVKSKQPVAAMAR